MTTTTAVPASSTSDVPVLHEVVAQRLVLPVNDDGSTLPLYVESTGGVLPDLVLDRTRMTVPAAHRLSFASYFNAFPASYWRKWTAVTAVQLRVQVTGVATVTVYRSNARGNPQRVRSVQTSGWSDELRFDLTLTTFGDGGWYWFDVVGGHDDAVLERAEWVVQAQRPSTGRATVSVTTFNRPADCVALLRSLTHSPDTMERIERIVIVDQGTQLVADQPDFDAAAQAADGKVDIVRQPNLGGSGGFARGMFEAAHRGSSDYVLLLDDDVLVEPEGILRGLTFADLARRPTIVGGHMMNMFIPSMMHSYGEVVNKYRFMWGPAPHVEEAHDFAKKTLRESEWLHRRIDVDYNGWWMCLIPTQVVRTIGLSMPIFIKWDDADFGLRAGQHGVPTVSLPGMAVWHVPWTDKDDTIDWQAYHHARNRLLMALLHSPYPRGGSLLRESFLIQLKHALSMQYSSAELRLWAIADILSGPDHLHRTLPTKLTEIRAYRAQQDDAVVEKDPQGFPAVKRARPPKRGKDPTAPRTLVGAALTAATGAARQLRAVRAGSRTHPEAAVPAMDGRWWLLSQFDSALVSTADGTGVSWYKRDPARFNDVMRRSASAHAELARRWDELSAQYRAAVTEVTSPDAWQVTWSDDGSG